MHHLPCGIYGKHVVKLQRSPLMAMRFDAPDNPSLLQLETKRWKGLSDAGI